MRRAAIVVALAAFGLLACADPLLASPRPEVVASASAELEYQGLLAQLVGADTINLHVGGAYGDKPAALARFSRSFSRLSYRVRRRLSVENDDTSYTVRDLLPLCGALSIPLVYDVHHHRCLPLQKDYPYLCNLCQ